MIPCFLYKQFFFSKHLTGETSKTKQLRKETFQMYKCICIYQASLYKEQQRIRTQQNFLKNTCGNYVASRQLKSRQKTELCIRDFCDISKFLSTATLIISRKLLIYSPLPFQICIILNTISQIKFTVKLNPIKV